MSMLQAGGRLLHPSNMGFRVISKKLKRQNKTMNVVYFHIKIPYTMDCLIPLFIQASVLEFLDLEAVANDDRSTDSEEHESDGALYSYFFLKKKTNINYI